MSTGMVAAAGPLVASAAQESSPPAQKKQRIENENRPLLLAALNVVVLATGIHAQGSHRDIDTVPFCKMEAPVRRLFSYEVWGLLASCKGFFRGLASSYQQRLCQQYDLGAAILERPLLPTGLERTVGLFRKSVELACLLSRGDVTVSPGMGPSGLPTAYQTPLIASITGHARPARAERVRRLIDLGVDVNWRRQQTDYTALYQAVNEIDPLVVRLLLQAGADANVPCGKQSITALHWAVIQGQVEIVQLLLQSPGTDPESLSGGGNSPLQRAEDRIRYNPSDGSAIVELIRTAIAARRASQGSAPGSAGSAAS
jgi:hypothetical protein